MLFLLIGMSVSAQMTELGMPYYERISPHFIGYSGPWGNITQDAENVLYFENDAGVIVFDGANWKLYPTHGMPKICRDASGKIFVGAMNFIGEMRTDEFNQRSIQSITRDSANVFGSVSDVAVFNGTVFFVAQHQLYAVRDSVPQKIDVDGAVTRLLLDRNKLYVATQRSLYEYSENLNSVVSQQITVLDVLHTDEFTLFETTNGLVKITPEKIAVPFATEIDAYLKDGDFSCFDKLTNNTICVGTKSHGLFCLDMDGKILFSLNLQNGFPDNKIQSVFVDKNNNVWVSSFSNLVRVEMNPAITYFNRYNGLQGSVLCVAKHKGALYVGTDCGVYRVENGKCVALQRARCNALLVFNGKLFAATEHGLINLTTHETLCTEAIKNAFIFDKNSLVTVSNESVVVWVERPTMKIRLQTKIPDIEITSVAHDNFQKYFAFFGTKSDGVWQTHIKSKGDSVLSFEIIPCEWQGLPKNAGRIDVYETSLGCLFSTTQGLFRCDCENNFFYRDGKILLPKDNGSVYVSPIQEDNEKNLWMALHTKGQYENQIAVAWNTNNLERYTLITAPFTKIRGSHISVMYPDENSVVWLGGNEGLVRMDFNRLSVKKTLGNVRLSQVLVNGDSLMTVTSGELTLPYNFKSLLFDFVAVEYENHNDIQYSYYLDGYEKTWSHTTPNNQVEYANLPSGKYAFHVRAKHLGNAVSKESVYEFRVQANPLLSGWAFAFYGLVLAIIGVWQFSEQTKRKARKIVAKTTQKAAVVEQTDAADSHTESGTNTNHNEIIPTERMRSMNFDVATVLFSDFKGFTKIAKRVSAESLIQELEKYFSEFDKIVEKYNVEKIKTVGDSYMCAGGIPKKNTTNPIEVVAAALEMQYRLKEMQKDIPEGAESWGIRIGIHTGPIIAGVVDGQKYAYDIWGDSVNIASRMEASGEVGRVNVSESTFIMVREFFDCEYRGKIQVQGKEEKADMYFVNGFKAVFSEHPFKAIPNQVFSAKLALLRFEGLQEDVYTLLEEHLPKTYFYHNLKHTIDVVVQVEVIGQAEGVSDEDMYILKTAALFHDAGFMRTYNKHEYAGIEIAREMLPNEGYSEEQIQKICDLISCTMMSVEPQTLLEQIICDADLDYLGRNDYVCVSRDLYKELLEQKLVKKNEYEWNLGQIQFLQEHKYYTNYSRSHRNPGKVRHIQWLQEQITKFNNII